MVVHWIAIVFAIALLARVSFGFHPAGRTSTVSLSKNRWVDRFNSINGAGTGLGMVSDSIGDADEGDFPEIDLTSLAGSVNVPKAPERPDEIEEDSFEGFLRGQFNAILEDVGGEQVSFTEFYVWRTKMGIVFDESEMMDLYMMVIEQAGLQGLDLMSFIRINKIVDENNSSREDGDPNAW